MTQDRPVVDSLLVGESFLSLSLSVLFRTNTTTFIAAFFPSVETILLASYIWGVGVLSCVTMFLH